MYKIRPIFLLVVSLLVACGRQPGQSPTSTFQPVPTVNLEQTIQPEPTVQPKSTEDVKMQGIIPLRSCRLGFGGAINGLCGTLSVLENRELSDGRRIELRIVVLPATGTPVEPDPVFFLAGGPSGAATEQWLGSKSMFPGLNQHRDIVLIDQRGTGRSHKIEYPVLPDLEDLTTAESAQAMQAWANEALDGIDADPRYYTTAIAMDDLDEVREALGYELINLYGGSYGATAAQVYLQRYATHVRSVVLDGGSLLDLHMMEPWARDAERSIDLLFSRCEADPDCSSAFPSIRQEFKELIARLRQHPITMHSSESGNVNVLTAWAVETIAQSALQNVHQAAALPKMIHEYYTLVKSANANEVTVPWDWSLVIATDEPTLMMSWAVFCNEYWARRDLDETARLSKGTLFKEWAMEGARLQTAICNVLPEGIAEEAPGTRVHSDVPVLIMNGEADPQNPPENVANATRELPNSLTLILPGAGHTVGHLGCLPQVVVDFIERGSIEGLETECVQTFHPPSFEVAD